MVTANSIAEGLTATEPVVSVIVPARNEEACLAACLASLLAQNEIVQNEATQKASSHGEVFSRVPFEIIVVDDHSTDRTREIAGSFPGVRVIDAPPLRTDSAGKSWTGKNNAVYAGARAARGEWLLFTDADTMHLPGSLARSLAEAQQHGAAMLSYSPEQIVETFWEKAVMPVIFAALASRYRSAEVNDPNSPVAAANGQYILIRRDIYDAVGGHAAIASDLLEDVALARRVKHSGRKIFFRYGGDTVRTRMYRTFAQLREGWTKNLAILFPDPRWLALQGLFTWLFAWTTAAFAIWLSFRRITPLSSIVILALAIPLLWLYAHIRRAHFAGDANLLAIAFGPPMFAYLLFRSAYAHRHGSVAWKGRQYSDKECLLTTGH